MKALRFHEKGDLRIDEVAPSTAPTGDDVTVLVSYYCGISGTDLQEYLAGPVFIPTEPPPGFGSDAGQAV